MDGANLIGSVVPVSARKVGEAGMRDREKVIKGIQECDLNGGLIGNCPFKGILALLKEQEKKEIKLHKKHVITWKRDDEFTTRKLYEAVCETLMDEGELVIVRIDDHEKVDFTFYVTHELEERSDS